MVGRWKKTIKIFLFFLCAILLFPGFGLMELKLTVVPLIEERRLTPKHVLLERLIF